MPKGKFWFRSLYTVLVAFLILLMMQSCEEEKLNLAEIDLRQYFYLETCDTSIFQMKLIITQYEDKSLKDTVPIYYENYCEQYGDVYHIITNEYFPSLLPKSYTRFEYGPCYGRFAESIDYFYPIDEPVVNVPVKIVMDTLYHCNDDGTFAHNKRTNLKMVDSSPKENTYRVTTETSKVLGIENLKHQGKTYECLVVENKVEVEIRAYNNALVEYDTAVSVSYYGKGHGLIKASGTLWKAGYMELYLNNTYTQAEFDSIRDHTGPNDWLNLPPEETVMPIETE